MAVLFVDDGGSNTSPFDTWAKAADGGNTGGLKAALADAACVAGSTIFIGHNSITTYTAAATLASQGTFALPVKIYSVTQGDETTYNPGAIETFDSAAAGKDITYTGFANAFGVTLKAGDDYLFTGANISWNLIDSTLEFLGAGSNDKIDISGIGGGLHLFNTNLIFKAAGQTIDIGGGGSIFEWFGGVLTFDINGLFAYADKGGRVIVRGVDLSSMVGGAFFNGFGATNDDPGFQGEIIGCKLHATPPALVLDTPTVDGVYLAMIGCGSAGIPQTHIHTSQGDVYHEITTVRTALYDGSNGYSYKMITNINAAFNTPLRYKLAEQWMAANPTITVEATHDAQGSEAGGNFGDDEFWIEIEYPDATVPAYRKWDRTSRMPTLGSSTIRSAGTSGDWTSGKTDFDKVVETISGGGAGIHTIWACLAPAEKTVYVCPKVDVS